MKGTIKIGTIETEMVAHAATPYFFKLTFGEDLLRRMNNTQLDVDVSDDTTDLIAKLGYVMAYTAEGKKPNEIQEGDFFDWLSQFEPFDLIQAATDIFMLYMANTKTSSKSKNPQSRQKGK